MPPAGAPSRRITRPLTWFQPITVPKSSGLTIWRISAIPDGMVSPAATPKDSAISEQRRRAVVPGLPGQRAERRGRPARATWPAISILRGSQRSAITPPTRTSTACGNISIAEHQPGNCGGERVRGRPRERDDPDRVAERRDRDADQPGEHHRVAANGRRGGADQLGLGLRRHGRTGLLGKRRIDRAHGAAIGVGALLLVLLALTSPLRHDRVEAPVQVGRLRGGRVDQAVARARGSTPLDGRVRHLLEPLLGRAHVVTEVLDLRLRRRPDGRRCPARSRRRSSCSRAASPATSSRGCRGQAPAPARRTPAGAAA